MYAYINNKGFGQFMDVNTHNEAAKFSYLLDLYFPTLLGKDTLVESDDELAKEAMNRGKISLSTYNEYLLEGIEDIQLSDFGKV